MKRLVWKQMIAVSCFTTGISGLTGFAFADEKVTERHGSVGEEANTEKNSADHDKFVEDSEQVGDKLRITSLRFVPPDNRKFTEFDTKDENQVSLWVDVIPGNVEGLPLLVPIAGETAIQAVKIHDTTPAMAAVFSLFLEGNLAYPEGEGDTPPPDLHWAAQVDDLLVDGMLLRFKLPIDEIRMSEQTENNENFYHCLADTPVRMTFELPDNLPGEITKYKWTKTDGTFVKGYFDKEEVATTEGADLKEMYWYAPNTVDYNSAGVKTGNPPVVTLTLEIAGNPDEVIETEFRIRTLKSGKEGDDAKMLQYKLRMTGVSSGAKWGWQADPIGTDGDFGANTDTGVKRWQKRSELTDDGTVGNGSIGSFANPWDDYVNAFLEYQTSPTIGLTHPYFETVWLPSGDEELGKVFTDQKMQNVSGTVERKDVLLEWVKKEASIGHWGKQAGHRVILGGFDSHGSIGFSQVQHRYAYGANSGKEVIRDVNLYHPEGGLRGFAVWSNTKGLGEGFYRVFVSEANHVENTFPATPKIGAAYTDDDADGLAKGLMGYKEGAFLQSLRTKTWPEMLKDYPNTGAAQANQRGIRYALDIMGKAGLPARSWTWTDSENGNNFTFTYSEQEWIDGKSWQTKRNESAPE